MTESPTTSAASDLVLSVVFWMLVAGMLALCASIAAQNWNLLPLTSPANTCINNLRQIDGAKQQWALEYHKDANDLPTRADLAVYLKDGNFPVCPGGGNYIIGRVDATPTCSRPGHELPQP